MYSMSRFQQKVAYICIGVLALLHVMIVLGMHHPLLLSNIVQAVAPILAIGICLRRARGERATFFRLRWYALATAFGIWSAAQGIYLCYLVINNRPPPFPCITDFFWLLFSFPFLLVAARSEEQQGTWNLTGLLDLAQGFVSACLLYAVLYATSYPYADLLVYCIQSTALLFACSIRYSTAANYAEKYFYRNLSLYVLIYGLMSAAGTYAQDHGSPAGSYSDFAWSFPVLFFCITALHPASEEEHAVREKRDSLLPAHIHGLSSLGLALTSLAAGVILTLNRPLWGIPALSIATILFSLRTAVRESNLKRIQEQLKFESQHDALTGLANRNLLMRELNHLDYSPVRKRALLFLDLDRFKVINDSLGHECGDRLLIHVAKILKTSVRHEDLVARLGGDEFVILLSEVSMDGTAECIAKRILEKLRLPVAIDGRVLQITGSIGIVLIQEEKHAIDLLRDADAAMYVAKSAGKNRCHVFDRSILEKTQREMELETELRRALREGSLSVAFQPIFKMPSLHLAGFEALARWVHPTQGPISPAEFIPLAEDTGLIILLGKQLLLKACEQLADWNNRFNLRLRMNINVSARQLADDEFLPFVKQTLAKFHLPSTQIKFEITESVLLQIRESAERTLYEAQDMGIDICLDDFGTGYSSLSYLTGFPFDVIKIDRRFVQDIEQNKQHAEILRTIIDLGFNLKKRITVEGVETKGQLDFLMGLNCNFVQGFLLSKPRTAQEAGELIAATQQAMSSRDRHVLRKQVSIPVSPEKSMFPN